MPFPREALHLLDAIVATEQDEELFKAGYVAGVATQSEPRFVGGRRRLHPESSEPDAINLLGLQAMIDARTTHDRRFAHRYYPEASSAAYLLGAVAGLGATAEDQATFNAGLAQLGELSNGN